MNISSQLLRKARVTAIGSCRIATPLKTASAGFGFSLNRARSFGFSHSSAEAVQQVKFMRGEIDPPAEIWPLLSQSDRDVIRSERHQKSDFYLVEICSGKELRIGGWLIQLNYLARRYPAFFGDVGRKGAFWRLTERGDQNALDALLSEEWSDTPEQHEDVKVLRQISLRMVKPADLARDMRWLTDNLGKLAFVSHVDALRSDETPIPARSALISDVVSTAHKIGVPVVNPTYELRSWGQERAMEAHGDSLSHYSDEFANKMAEVFVTEVIGDSIFETLVSKGDEAGIVQILAALQAESLLGCVVQRLDRTMAEMPEWGAVGYFAFLAATETNDLEMVDRLLSSGALGHLSAVQKDEFVQYCSDQGELHTLAKVLEVDPQAGIDLPYLTKIRLQDLDHHALDTAGPDLVLQIKKFIRDGNAPLAMALVLENLAHAESHEVTAKAIADKMPQLADQLVQVATSADIASAYTALQESNYSKTLAEPVFDAIVKLSADQVRMARQSDTLSDLADFVAGLGDLADKVENLRSDFAYLALRHREYELALRESLSANKQKPTDVRSLVVAMRSSAQTGELIILSQTLDQLSVLGDALDDHYSAEVKKRSMDLPRMFYNKASGKTDTLTAISYLKRAMSSTELQSRAKKKISEKENQFLQEAKDRLLSRDESLESDLNRAREFMRDHPRVLYLLGRFLVLRSRFADALLVWKRLIEVDPTNARAVTELNRCILKTS